MIYIKLDRKLPIRFTLPPEIDESSLASSPWSSVVLSGILLYSFQFMWGSMSLWIEFEFPWCLMILSTYSWLTNHLGIFFWELSVHISCQFSLGYWIYVTEMEFFVCNLDASLSLYTYGVWIFFPSLWLFLLLTGVFGWAVFQFVVSFYCHWYFYDVSKTYLCTPHWENISLYRLLAAL